MPLVLKESRDISARYDKQSGTVLIHYCVLYSEEWSSRPIDNRLVQTQVVLLGLTGQNWIWFRAFTWQGGIPGWVCLLCRHNNREREREQVVDVIHQAQH